VFIGGIFLILTAVLNPEGIAGGIRTQVAARRNANAARRTDPVPVPA
jgi:hypothetical protein